MTMGRKSRCGSEEPMRRARVNRSGLNGCNGSRLEGGKESGVRVGLTADWLETWPWTGRSECDNWFTVHVNKSLSQI